MHILWPFNWPLPAAFSFFMSSIFKPLIRKNKIITYLDDVFIQDNTTDKTLQTFYQYNKILKNENTKATPDKSFFFLDSVKFWDTKFKTISYNHQNPKLKDL